MKKKAEKGRTDLHAFSSDYITPDKWAAHGPKIVGAVEKALSELEGKYTIDPTTNNLVRKGRGQQ